MEELNQPQHPETDVTPSAAPTPEQVNDDLGETLDEAAIQELLKNTAADDLEAALPPGSVIALWATGLLIGAASLIWFIAGAVSVCSPNDSLCSVNNLMTMMFSSTGMLIGGVLFVSGLFALRRFRRRR